VAKPELGTKRNCPACAARFYDLNRQPITCPKCAEEFEPEVLLKPRRTRAKVEEAPKEPTAEEKEEAELAEVDDAENAEVDDDENEIKEIDLENPVILSDDEDSGDDEPAPTDTPLEDNLTVVDENKDILAEENAEDDEEAVLMDELGDEDLPEVEDEEETEDPK